jgi:hypothetical protein
MRLRPRWAVRVQFWLADGQYDRLIIGNALDTHWGWAMRGQVEKVGLRALCLLFGHDPVADQCGRPEHDHCLYCGKPMPGRARRGAR